MPLKPSVFARPRSGYLAVSSEITPFASLRLCTVALNFYVFASAHFIEYHETPCNTSIRMEGNRLEGWKDLLMKTLTKMRKRVREADSDIPNELRDAYGLGCLRMCECRNRVFSSKLGFCCQLWRYLTITIRRSAE